MTTNNSFAANTVSSMAGSVSYDSEDWKLEEGIWFKSKTTGRLFASGHIPICDIDCVLIDGVWFDRSEWKPNDYVERETKRK